MSEASLPLPVISNGDVPTWNGRIGVERAAAPLLIAFTTGLAAVSSHQPRVMLVFIAAGIVILGLYFVVPPRNHQNMHPIVSTFLRRIPDTFTALGCVLIVFGIVMTFPNEVALVPLFLFIFFAALALFCDMVMGALATTAMYAAAMISLTTFVVLAFIHNLHRELLPQPPGAFVSDDQVSRLGKELYDTAARY